MCTPDPERSLPQGLHTLDVDQAEVQNLYVLLYVYYVHL
jgi:hypothetical protein